MGASDLPIIGLRYGLPIEHYHGSAGISKTGLDAIERSPAIYYALHRDPDRPAPKERAGQLEGSLAHAATLEPDEFEKRYRTIPDGAPRRPTSLQRHAKKPSPETIEAVAYWDDWLAQTGNATIITFDQRETAMRQAEAVRALPEVRELLAKGAAEVSACWRDALTGELCRCRPDWLHNVNDSAAIILDLKTFSTGDPREFARQCARKRWHVQSAFYTDGFAIASGLDVLAFVFVVVASEYPYDASACMLDEASMEAGRRAYRKDLDTYAECRRSGIWPGYGEGIHLISLPQWAMELNE